MFFEMDYFFLWKCQCVVFEIHLPTTYPFEICLDSIRDDPFPNILYIGSFLPNVFCAYLFITYWKFSISYEGQVIQDILPTYCLHTQK